MQLSTNDHSAWRAFEESELTHSAAHYLMTILNLRRRFGYARVTDVAEQLRISRGAASRAIAVLKDRGWLDEDSHRMILLTDAGRDLAAGVERNHTVTEVFLREVLGLPEAVAHEDACKVEHLLSPATVEALGRMMQMLERNHPLLKRVRDKLETLSLEPPVDPLLESAQRQEKS